MITKAMPPEIEGMITVSYEAFFGTVGKLNVHPRIVNEYSYDQTFGYLTEWIIQNTKEVVGISNGGTTFSETRYMVTKKFYDANIKA